MDYRVSFSLRIDPKLHQKIKYIAEYEGRTQNSEIVQLIKKRVNDYEKQHGVIDVE